MAPSLLPPSSIFQSLTCRKGSTIDVHERTDGLHRKYNVTDADGLCGTFLVWSGSNLMQSQNLMSQFQDRSRSRFRCVQANHHFQIAEPCTQLAAEASDPSADDAKAILLVRGTLTTGESAKTYFAPAQAGEGGSALGKATSAVPGTVATIFLQQIHGNGIGGCYLFRDAQSLDEYLASDLWASTRADTPWQEVLVEKYSVLAEPAAAA